MQGVADTIFPESTPAGSQALTNAVADIMTDAVFEFLALCPFVFSNAEVPPALFARGNLVTLYKFRMIGEKTAKVIAVVGGERPVVELTRVF